MDTWKLKPWHLQDALSAVRELHFPATQTFPGPRHPGLHSLGLELFPARSLTHPRVSHPGQGFSPRSGQLRRHVSQGENKLLSYRGRALGPGWVVALTKPRAMGATKRQGPQSQAGPASCLAIGVCLHNA